MVEANATTADLASGYAGTSTGKTDKEVHTVNTSGGVVFDTQVNVFVDTETKVAGIREVLLKQLVFLHLEATFQNLEGFFSPHCHMDGNLFVTTDTERTKSVSSLGEDWLLACQLFQHTRRTGQSVTRLSDTAVEDQLVHFDFPHGIRLGFRHF